MVFQGGINARRRTPMYGKSMLYIFVVYMIPVMYDMKSNTDRLYPKVL